MATRSLQELKGLNDDDLVTREEIGVLAELTRREGKKHETVNLWIYRYRPGGIKPTFPPSTIEGDSFAAKHRLGNIREWLVETGRLPDTTGLLMSKTEVCDLLGIMPETLKSWIWRDIFPRADSRQGRFARWKRTTVETWVEKNNRVAAV